jgi:phage terminase large subunit-like protein
LNKLLPWQHFVQANMYGWIDRKTGLRRFREALILVGAGNGKSTMVTGNATFAISKDGERGAEAYCLANSKQQARTVYNSCREQIEASPFLAKHFRTTYAGVYYDKTNGLFEPRATDSRNSARAKTPKPIAKSLKTWYN